MASTVNGKCLCGAVGFRATLKSDDVAACHCTMCRRMASGPFIVVEADGVIQVTGEDSLAIYKSSEWAERAFCKTCGSNMYYRLSGQEAFWLSAGMLVDPPQMQLATERSRHLLGKKRERVVCFDLKPQFAPPACHTRACHEIHGAQVRTLACADRWVLGSRFARPRMTEFRRRRRQTG
jgi:hypothetical protein